MASRVIKEKVRNTFKERNIYYENVPKIFCSLLDKWESTNEEAIIHRKKHMQNIALIKYGLESNVVGYNG